DPPVPVQPRAGRRTGGGGEGGDDEEGGRGGGEPEDGEGQVDAAVDRHGLLSDFAGALSASRLRLEEVGGPPPVCWLCVDQETRGVQRQVGMWAKWGQVEEVGRGHGAAAVRLRRRIAELESENEMLRRRGQGEGSSHDVLPVVVTVVVSATRTVDLSRVTTCIVTHITSFLGTSRELLNMALTCISFGWRQPGSTLNWSLVEEVARQAVCSRATDDEMGCLPRYVGGTATWLSILHKYEHLLLFDVLLGGYIKHRNGDKTAVCSTDENYCDSVAVSSSYVMKSGTHYAEFLITGEPYIGIVRPMPGLDAGAYQEEFDFFDDNCYPDFRAQISSDWDSDVHACDFSCDDGKMSFTDFDDDILGDEWEGMESCQSGDTVGMLLNLDEGTLTVYKNNRRLGVLKVGLSGPPALDGRRSHRVNRRSPIGGWTRAEEQGPWNIVVAATVNLSRADTSLVIQIS
ncbi:hypothetical protein THAOC_34995, partial [Thalassiosira oceanica]